MSRKVSVSCWLQTSLGQFHEQSCEKLRNAFYYSYFQELVDAEVVSDALHDIVWDKRTEYPDVLNAIRRFNIYQEGACGCSLKLR